MTPTLTRPDSATTTIHDAERYPGFDAGWFDRDWWASRGARTHSTTGRGSVLMLDRGDETWVYRHYHRGGLVARFVYDRYLWLGAERTRSIREWRLLARLSERGLPVPRPVAGRAVRAGPVYRADILTVLLPDTAPLSGVLEAVRSDADLWHAIGRMLGRIHREGCDHPDLTAHNVLIGPRREPYLVDFDNARLRTPGRWQDAGLTRFRRSLRKVSRERAIDLDAAVWRSVVAGYRDTSA